MQLLTENPYASPTAIESVSIQVAKKASFRRGLYYAGLWGLVVLPVPAIWLLMQWLLRPDLPPPRLPDGSLNSIFRIVVGMSILPAFFGLVAIANYTSARRYRYLVTFLYFKLAYIGVVSALNIMTECWGGPLHRQRRYPDFTDQEIAWNFACIATPILLFGVLLTCWRIEYGMRGFEEATEANHAH